MKKLLLTMLLLLAPLSPTMAEEYLLGIEGAYLTKRPPLGGATLTLRGYRDLPVSLRLHYRYFDDGTELSTSLLYDPRTYPLGYYTGLGLGWAFGVGTAVAHTVLGVRYSPFDLPGELYLEWTPSFPNLGLDLTAGVALRLYARGF